MKNLRKTKKTKIFMENKKKNCIKYRKRKVTNQMEKKKEIITKWVQMKMEIRKINNRHLRFCFPL